MITSLLIEKGALISVLCRINLRNDAGVLHN